MNSESSIDRMRMFHPDTITRANFVRTISPEESGDMTLAQALANPAIPANAVYRAKAIPEGGHDVWAAILL